MQVRFIGHAGIQVETNGLNIVCDPWLFGKVFNNGWALTSPSHRPDFSSVTHVWISHEHPDHFHFPSLKSIPDADKARITILHQRHASPRVVDAIRKMGFTNIVELPLYAWHPLGNGVEVFCGSAWVMDSFLAVRDGRDCLLNMNDCVFGPDQLAYIKRSIGDLSILFTQFSFANWAGNDHDETQSAQRKIEQLTRQVATFRPAFTVPFASFVYFCNRENERMNAWVNTPDMIAKLNIPGLNFMYPGDEWDSEVKAFDSARALDRYRADYAHKTIDDTPAPKDITEITAAVNICLKGFQAKVRPNTLQKLPPFTIFIHDLDTVIDVNPARGICQVIAGDPEANRTARYVMCSQVAWFTFNFSFGGNTTVVSGMYLDREFEKKGFNPFFNVQIKLSTEALSLGGLRQTLRTANYLWRKKWEIFYGRVGQLKGQGVSDD